MDNEHNCSCENIEFDHCSRCNKCLMSQTCDKCDEETSASDNCDNCYKLFCNFCEDCGKRFCVVCMPDDVCTNCIVKRKNCTKCEAKNLTTYKCEHCLRYVCKDCLMYDTKEQWEARCRDNIFLCYSCYRSYQRCMDIG